MYKLFLKSQKTPIIVPDSYGAKVKEFFEDDNIPDDAKIKIEQWSGFKSGISGIYFESEKSSPSSEQTSNDFNRKDAEWREYRSSIQKLPIEERAKDLAWFQLIVQSSMMKTPAETPDEAKKEAIEINKKFFTENHYRLVTDPHLYKHILTGSKGLDSILGPTIRATVVKDMQYADREAQLNGVSQELFNL